MAFSINSFAGTSFEAIPYKIDGRIENKCGEGGGCRLNRLAEHLRQLKFLRIGKGKGCRVLYGGNCNNAKVGL